MTLTRKRVHVLMRVSDGSELEGTVVIDRTTRLSDVLNKGDKDFIALNDYENQVHIINKHHIIKVMEITDGTE